MPVKNEADRWLEACLSWASTFADAIHVYDDQSDDDTPEVAAEYAAVSVRPGGHSFLEHEGNFREFAWTHFEEALQPEHGDWVLALDADEFLVGNTENLRLQLEEICSAADRGGYVAVLLPVPEMFGADFNDDGLVTTLHRRTDGEWGRIAGTRLFRYEVQPEDRDPTGPKGGRFRKRAMGCGSEPRYVGRGRHLQAPDIWLLHLGYVRNEDKAMKHERYTSLLDHGHNNAHVQSIITNPTLETWPGPVPPIWMGVRD